MLKTDQRDRLSTLSIDELTSLIHHHDPHASTLPELTRDTLDSIIARRRMDHATLLRPILGTSRPTEIRVLEVMVGKPITRIQKITRHHQPQRLTRVRTLPEDNRVISGIVSNPKKPGSASYDRFALYREGMTVSEARAAGITTGDLKWDVEKGFIQII